MDYAAQLQAEVQGAHAVFHEFAMLLARAKDTAHFFFFEGEEDPSFYMSFAHPRLNGRDAHVFICSGRTEVIKALELVERDGRAISRSMFFVDKDHTDYCKVAEVANNALFQTVPYSIENYIVCFSVLRRYWVERLHLSDNDKRWEEISEDFDLLHRKFFSKARILMAAVLLGRGIDGHRPIKLNLNNVQLDRVFKFDYQKRYCGYVKNAAGYFIASTDLRNASLSSLAVRQICRKYLVKSDPKKFIRGKFELWFFWKFLVEITKQLSDREEAKKNKLRRATPRSQLTLSGCFELLAPLVHCPPELEAFFVRRLA